MEEKRFCVKNMEQENIKPTDNTQEAQPEKEEMEIDFDTENKIDDINNSIEIEKSLYNSLDKFSLDSIDEINQGIEKEKSGYINIGTSENDAENIYGKAGLRRKFEYFINPNFTGGKKYIEEKRGVFKSKEKGLLDRFKINEEILGQNAEISDEDKDAVIEKFKDTEAEFKANSATYERVGNEITKRIEFTRTATEQERIDEANNVLENNFKNLETDGKELAQLKKNFEVFKREKESGLEDMKDDSDLKIYEEKLQEEENVRQENIKDAEEKLQDQLDIYREPLNERKNEFNEAIGKFSEKLEVINSEEKTFKDNINILNSKIKKFSGFKEARNSFQDKIEQWEEQKKQTEVNLAGFQKMKIDIKHRLDVLKINKKEIDKSLKRTNRIGKTEKEVKKSEEQNLKSESESNANDDVEQKKSEEHTGGIEEDVDAESEVNETEHKIPSDAMGDTAGQETDAVEIKEQEVQEITNKKSHGDAQIEQVQRIDQKIEEEPKATTRIWLEKLKLDIYKNDNLKQAIQKYFRKNRQKYNETAVLTLQDAKWAYVQYLIDKNYNGLKSDEAIKKAESKFNQIKKEWK